MSLKMLTKAELQQEILNRFDHFYKQTSGVYLFPNNMEGDLLRMVNLCFRMEDEQIKQIKDARDAVERARNIQCECSGFVLQYEGCLCKRAHALDAAKKHFWQLIGSL